MKTQTIAVLGQKGGAGKTTAVINLAAAAHLAGLRTIIIDLDPQGSATWWSSKRSDTSKLSGLTVVKRDEPCPIARYREIGEGYSLVLLDGPARLGPITRAAAKFADTVLMPIQPAGLDLAATNQTLESLNDADMDRMDSGLAPVRRCFVLSRATVGTTVARQAPSVIETAGEIVGVFHQRQEFNSSASTGESVLTTEPGGKAAFEVRKVVQALGFLKRHARVA